MERIHEEIKQKEQDQPEDNVAPLNWTASLEDIRRHFIGEIIYHLNKFIEHIPEDRRQEAEQFIEKVMNFLNSLDENMVEEIKEYFEEHREQHNEQHEEQQNQPEVTNE